MTSGLFVRWDQQMLARVASLVFAALVVASCNANTTSAPQRTASVTRGSIYASVNAIGNIMAEAEVKLSFEQPGVVSQVSVKAGDAVKKGQELARLDTHDLELALELARTALVTADANYSRTIEGPNQADIDAAQASLNAAYSQYEILKAGPQPGDIANAQVAYLNAQISLQQAQNAYAAANRRNPAGINGSMEALALEQATNAYNLAKARYDKASEGADGAQISAALQQIATAKATLSKLKEPPKPYDVEQAQQQQKQAQLQVEQASLNLARAILTAPRDGIISDIAVDAGEMVGTQPVMTLMDLSTLHVDITVDEIDVARIKPGLPVLISLDALPDTQLRGVVDRIAPTSSTLNGVVSYLVRVVLDQTGTPLKAGMTASAAVILEQHANTLIVPNWAVRYDKHSGKSYLTVPVAGTKTSKEVEVQTGLRNETSTEIVSGVSDGQVIMAPQSSFLSQLTQ